ncbi:protein TRANSPARENT TESTA 9-like isoform X4 [Trifolium pratense]|uniref:protein TRANSPARENT TESTA 9-like isoform X4 n=1 Tax=Trifolium pratense TaxID=57577 RepID=UPI001E6968F2|nr:protein TRANSPARENT TESTA 9-like isoform X4 [Trifolium pratense]
MYDSTIMWNSFWRSRDRFSLDQLRYLTDQLTKVQVVNEVNKDFVIEALRSIAELMTYGDQHDPSYFEYFMEKQVMGEFVRILKLSKTVSVPLQLLQTVSILVQNLRNEHAIYYLFSNEHINYLITYSFDFQNEELLSYYISFLRAISGKLNKNTVSLLVKIRGDEVVSFPLYVEAIRFAFHEENMVRTAVRAVTLNVYHVGDDSVNRYISSVPHKDYFSNLISFFRKQSIDLNKLVSHTLINPGPDSTSTIIAAIDEIEDNLYYVSDIVSAGIPDVGRLITDSILTVLIFPLLLPSLRIAIDNDNDIQSGVVTSLYLLCCILRIIKIKDLANTIAAALFYPSEAFTKSFGGKFNSHISDYGFPSEYLVSNNHNLTKSDIRHSMFNVPHSSSSSGFHPEGVLMQNDCSNSNLSLRDVLLAYVTKGDDIQVLGSLSVLATLLKTKELDESMLDGLGILPQRKQHKKLLLQALVGESSGEEELFSSKSSLTRDSTGSDIDVYHDKIKDRYGISCQSSVVGNSPHVNRFQVIDALVNLFCRSNISAVTLWEGGWLLRRLLPYSESEFNSHHLELLKVSYNNCAAALVEEVKGIWTDFLISVLCDEWRKCKRAMESSSPPKEPNCVLLLPHPHYKFSLEDDTPKGSSFAVGERMQELVKVFVLLHQLQLFTLGRALPEQPPIDPTGDLPTNRRAQTSGLDASGPKAGTEISLVNAVPCRIAFKSGKEHHFCFRAISLGISGWLVLAEELPSQKSHGIVRVTAPLAGCDPRIDDKHSTWLHLRIRSSSLPFLDPAKSNDYGRIKTKSLVDGRWTLAFRDEQSCNSALAMIVEEINILSDEVHRRLKPLLNLETAIDLSSTDLCVTEDSSNRILPKSL